MKLLSPWYYSTDGFQGVNSVDQSFAFAGTTGNAVFRGGYWGNPANDRYLSTANNVDIKTYNSDAWAQFGAPLTPAVFEIWTTTALTAIQTRPIRTSSWRVTWRCRWRCCRTWRIRGAHRIPVCRLGSSYNLAFSNITVTGSQKTLSEIKSRSGCAEWLPQRELSESADR